MNISRWLVVSMLTVLFSQMAQAAVLVSNKPLALLYQALRPQAKVDILLASNIDMHTYHLKVQDLVKIRQAEQVFWLGELNEPFLKASAEKQASANAWIAVGDRATHSWLGQQQVILLIKQLTTILIAQYPQEQELINQRAQQLTLTINERFIDWQKRLQPLQSKAFLLGHDAFKVFANDMGITQVLMYRANNDHGHQQAGMQELLGIQKRIESGELSCALEEPEVSFAALQKRYPQLRLSVLDPLANNIPVSEQGYLSFIDENAQAFAQCFQ